MLQLAVRASAKRTVVVTTTRSGFLGNIVKSDYWSFYYKDDQTEPDSQKVAEPRPEKDKDD